MMTQPWEEKFDHILRHRCRLVASEDVVDPDVSFDLLGVDSVELLGLIIDSEEVFGVEIPANMLTGDVLATPRTFWRALKELMSGGWESPQTASS